VHLSVVDMFGSYGGWHEGNCVILVRGQWRRRTVSQCWWRHTRHCSGPVTYL